MAALLNSNGDVDDGARSSPLLWGTREPSKHSFDVDAQLFYDLPNQYPMGVDRLQFIFR